MDTIPDTQNNSEEKDALLRDNKKDKEFCSLIQRSIQPCADTIVAHIAAFTPITQFDLQEEPPDIRPTS